jgi:GntR family carbon starvation induced transcriptional regulator
MNKLKTNADRRPTGGTLASATYARLRRDIIEGTIPPGSKLRMRQLCGTYAVGLSPLREALNRLSRDGLVRQTDLRGFVASPLSRAELDELTKTRCWLNELALRQSIEHGDSAWEEQVVLTYHRLSRTPLWVSLEDSALRGVNPAWEVAHRAFHASLISGCGSSWLMSFCEQLFDVADRYRNLSRSPALRRERQTDEHKPIMEATIARNADEAVRFLTQHFRRTAELGHRALEAGDTAASPLSESSRTA